MSDLHPIHHSIAGQARLPNKMDRIKAPPEMIDALTRIALDIWTDCSNAGHPFQSALLAVYLSGLQHGSALRTETKP